MKNITPIFALLLVLLFSCRKELRQEKALIGEWTITEFLINETMDVTSLDSAILEIEFKKENEFCLDVLYKEGTMVVEERFEGNYGVFANDLLTLTSYREKSLAATITGETVLVDSLKTEIYEIDELSGKGFELRGFLQNSSLGTTISMKAVSK